jgi:hypothetical protein
MITQRCDCDQVARGKVLVVHNGHVKGCGLPPTVDATGKYVSYFQNPHLEQWVFVGDPESGKITLYGGDLGWEPVEITVEDPVPRLILNETEKWWICLCIAAMTSTAPDEVMSRYNNKARELARQMLAQFEAEQKGKK